jgi:hypothetical protein
VGQPANFDPEALAQSAAELGLAQLSLEVVSVRPASYSVADVPTLQQDLERARHEKARAVRSEPTPWCCCLLLPR